MVHHPHVQLVQRPVNAGRVEKRDLAALVVEDADDSIARRLRFRGNDRDLLPEDAIEQRRLAGVRTSDERDDAEVGLGSGLGFISHE